MKDAAVALDDHIWLALEGMCGQHIPKGEEGSDVECVVNVPGVPELRGRSFQKHLIGQPIKLGGIGLRPLAETCPAAFLGGIEMSLPHLASVDDAEEGGLCPQLAGVLGGGVQRVLELSPV